MRNLDQSPTQKKKSNYNQKDNFISKFAYLILTFTEILLKALKLFEISLKVKHPHLNTKALKPEGHVTQRW